MDHLPAAPGKDLPDEEIWKMLAYIRSLHRGIYVRRTRREPVDNQPW
jgi:hypothetical protein